MTAASPEQMRFTTNTVSGIIQRRRPGEELHPTPGDNPIVWLPSELPYAGRVSTRCPLLTILQRFQQKHHPS